MESSSIFGAEKMEPNDFENNERALVAFFFPKRCNKKML